MTASSEELTYSFSLFEYRRCTPVGKKRKTGKTTTTEPLNGQIALAPAEDEHLDITALENEACLHEEFFRAIARSS